MGRSSLAQSLAAGTVYSLEKRSITSCVLLQPSLKGFPNLSPVNLGRKQLQAAMSQQLTAKSQPNCGYMTSSTTATKLTCYYKDAYDTVIRRFRLQVPQLDILRIRAATSDQDVTHVLEDASSPSGFVLFADYNHAGWMRHFTTEGGALQRAHRFTFGNPLYALPVLQQNIEAALHIPLDCCFIEELDENRTKLVVTLPSSFLETADDDGGVRRALADVEAKLFALVQRLVAQP